MNGNNLNFGFSIGKNNFLLHNNIVKNSMKLKLMAAVLSLALYSCESNTATDTKGKEPKAVTEQWQPPVAGSIVDKTAQRVTEDNLNESYFRVSIISTDSSKAGHYILKLEYGYNINEVPVSLPA